MKLTAEEQKYIDKFIKEKRLKENNVDKCPHCDSDKILKRGMNIKKQQKYQCKNCDKYFSKSTNTLFSSTKKSMDKWELFIHLMFSNFYTLRTLAKDVGISLPTAFYWRHKVLNTVKQNMKNIRLKGKIVSDETYFKRSYSGNYKNKRMLDKITAGNIEGKLRGLSRQKVCVLTSMDSNGNCFIKPVQVAKIQLPSLFKYLSKIISHGSFLITDKEKSYKSFCKKLGFKLKQYKNERIYDENGNFLYFYSDNKELNRINSLHSRLKQWSNRFRGISTKHINAYMDWFNWSQIMKKNFHDVKNHSKINWFDIRNTKTEFTY